MITSVRFPFAVQVVKLEGHIEWQPGKKGVKSIAWGEPGRGLLFTMDDGKTVNVIPPPGSVIDETWVAPIVAEVKPNGSTDSTPSARPIAAQSSRKGR